jgi:hypothetical protein
MVRFLIGSSLLFIGTMVMASAAITVVGLPIGLIVLAGGLQMLTEPRRRPGRAGSEGTSR